MKKFFLTVATIAMSISATAQWNVDRSHSGIKFTVSHMMISEVDGLFKDFSGTFTSDKDDFSDLKTSFTIQTKSISTDNEKRDAHLNSPDFFDAEKYPTITFTSTSITKNGDKKYTLVGKLNLHGITKSVTWELKGGNVIKDPYGNNRAGFKATTTLKRSDFGLSPDTPSAVLGDEVEVTVNFEITKK
ncbi:MAG: YceI family protein [Flavobacteriaceae bacterium]|jgi:polyisoprenoid-binding protein YceI|nr:YceI family protein [Flavobacteriaceae bacterium]